MADPGVAAPIGRRKLRRFLSAAGGTLAALLTALWLIGCFFYSSVGIDNERRDGDWIVWRSWRVQWIGDGTIGAAWGVQYLHAANHPPPMAFDLGGRILQEPRHPHPKNLANRIGFWANAISWPSPTGHAPDNSATELRIPGWLLPLLWIAHVRGGRRTAFGLKVAPPRENKVEV